ncbi:MAG: SufD family Fe-S cluster assembly protein [Candidatus Micrarchaeaceae archaeon]
MQDYKEFVKEAIEQYEKLPQEMGELYKRHYINIPYDLKSFGGNEEHLDDGILKDSIDQWASKLGVKFDIAIGSSNSTVAGPNEFVRIEQTEKLDKSMLGQMYRNNEDKYVAYINANAERSILIDVPSGKSADINILLFNSAKPLATRIFISVGNGSKLNVFEYYGSSTEKPTALGVMHDINIGDDCQMELNSVHNENSDTLSIGFCKNRIGENSHLRFNSLYNGSAQTRVRNVIEANKDQSKVEVNEIILGSSKQKFDINTYIVNSGTHTNASLESKAALMDESFCIMKGFAKIKKGASKAKSYVHERGILLDKNAKVDGLPDMSVDENDVKATHSSATAPVDPESVFYLMSKGIDEIGVRKLLVTGFFAEVVSRMHNNLMKEVSMSLINSKLDKRNYGEMPSIDTRNMWIGSGSEQETDMFKGHYKYRGAE